jgi:hypothetical protein
MLRTRNALTIFEGVIVVATIGLLSLLLLANVERTCQGSAPRAACHHRLGVIVLALHEYETHHGHLPPAYTVDDKGNRLHSWRTLILPYLEQQSLYDSIDLTKSWDDPANAKAYAAVIEVYQCPAGDLDPGMTTYVAPFGPDWSFATEKPRSLDEVGDETVLVMEIDPQRAVHWMSPYDFEDAKALPFDGDDEGVHLGSWIVALSDGQVMSIDRTTPPDEIREMLLIRGEEVE